MFKTCLSSMKLDLPTLNLQSMTVLNKEMSYNFLHWFNLLHFFGQKLGLPDWMVHIWIIEMYLILFFIILLQNWSSKWKDRHCLVTTLNKQKTTQCKTTSVNWLCLTQVLCLIWKLISTQWNHLQLNFSM